jgi:hypothetical protein
MCININKNHSTGFLSSQQKPFSQKFFMVSELA